MAEATTKTTTTTTTTNNDDDDNNNNNEAKSMAQCLQDLGIEYQDLCQKETEILSLLEKLKQEEDSLSQAINQLDAIRNNKNQNRMKKKEPSAIQRLEAALLRDDSSTGSSSSSDKDNDEGKLGFFTV